jgi:hypothetical protein
MGTWRWIPLDTRSAPNRVWSDGCDHACEAHTVVLVLQDPDGAVPARRPPSECMAMLNTASNHHGKRYAFPESPSAGEDAY